MKRNSSLMSAFALLLMMFVPVQGTGCQMDNELPLHTQKLSDKVLVAWVGDYMQTIRVVALSTARGIVVIETNLSRAADVRIRHAIEMAFCRKDFKYLINTHFHHDHTCGNQIYADATIVGHKTVPEGMKRELTGEGLVKLLEMFKSDAQDWEKRRDKAAPDSRDYHFFREGVVLLKMTIAELQDGFTPTFPSVLFDKSLMLDMGDMTVELYAVGGTHTKSDIMIFVPEEGLVAIGDMWPDRVLPCLRKEAPWDLGLILENWGRIVESGREIKHVNMAHSDMKLGVETFKQQYRYLKMLWDGVREMRNAGATLDDAKKKYTIERDFPYFKDRMLAARGTNIHENNIEAIWARQGAVAGEIHDAVRAGDLAKVKALVAKDPKVVNEKDTRGRTPLHFASDGGSREMIAFLIANGADVKATDPDGSTPLHWAAWAGQADAARALIAAGADPNARNGRGADALESAFYGRHPEAVEALLQGGLKVETKGEPGRALLHRAASAGFQPLVDHLIAHGADAVSKHYLGKTLLHSAAEGGLSAMVVKMIEGGANVNAADDLGQTPLHLAASGGRKDMVDMLIAKGANVKAVCRDGRNLLHCAAFGGLVDLMDRLVKAGFPVDSPDRYGRTPLLKAAEAGSDVAAEFLLSRGANVMSRDYYQQTPLHEATFSGNLRLLDILVKHGADVHAVNEEGSTPLLYVSQAGRAEVIDWLLEHGARLDVRNKLNETPLTFPLGNGFLELVEKLWPRAEALKNKDLMEKYPLHRVAYLGNARTAAFLLGKGIPIDLKDEIGRTPFQRAAQGGSVEIAQMLLDKGAKVDAPDPEGSTPLHLAVKKGRTDMVRFLLKNKADPKAKDGKGRTPLDLAMEYSYPNLVGILEEEGAEPTPNAEKMDVPSLLAKNLKKGEAIVWSLGHCGFAVKTQSRLLIFDYYSRGWPRPEKPSLANGFINPEEIKDQHVTVFVSHSHGDHFDPVILSWQSTVKDIQYIFGWKAGKGDRAIDMPAPRATKTLGAMEIFTVNCEHNDVPEVAYLVKVDGLAIYHSGDYMGPIDNFQADMNYLLGKAGTIDLAFIGKFPQAASLKPRVVFPIHAYNREFMYGAFAREAAAKKLPSRVICPENKGDRFMLFIGAF